MLLGTVLGEYFALNPSIRCQHTRDQYGFAVANLGEAIGSPPSVADLTDTNLARTITTLQMRGLAAKTINERIGRLKALWRWLADQRRVDTRPTIKKIVEPQRVPVAWSQDELRRLVLATKFIDRDLAGGICAEWFWHSLILTAWDTGERISALLSARYDWINGNWLAIPAEYRKGKTKDRVYRLTDATIAAIRNASMPPREFIWPWSAHRSSLYNHYRRLLKLAKLPADRKSMFHRIRRSVATHVEAAGGNATKLLDHSSRRLTEKSYLDPRFLPETHAVDYLFRIG